MSLLQVSQQHFNRLQAVVFFSTLNKNSKGGKFLHPSIQESSRVPSFTVSHVKLTESPICLNCHWSKERNGAELRKGQL